MSARPIHFYETNLLWISRFKNLGSKFGTEFRFDTEIGEVENGDLVVMDFAGLGDRATALVESLVIRGARVVAHISHSNTVAIKSARAGGVSKVIANGKIEHWLIDTLQKEKTEA